MANQISVFPEVGWMEESFQVHKLDDENCEFDWTIQPGGSVPKHIHIASDEHFEILEGEVTFLVKDEIIIGNAGFELTIPKMTPHSVSNKSNKSVKCKVSYIPVADQGKFFLILFFLNGKNPKDGMALFKTLYISDKMKYRPFSTFQGGMKIVMGVMMGVFKIFAPLTGWNKLLAEYKLKSN